MMRILLSGCHGRMGQAVTKLTRDRDDVVIIAGVDPKQGAGVSYPVFSSMSDYPGNADLVMDFSHPSAFQSVLDYCLFRNTPLVLATTGLSAHQHNLLQDAGSTIPVFFSANMSMGITLLVRLSRIAARFLGDGFDIEILEKHHNQKLDAPSGTAYILADAIREELGRDMEYVYDRHSAPKKRSHNEIGIHAVRGGSITGEHTILFAGQNEIIELTHRAVDRNVFAAGALRAAFFLKDQSPGIYSMNDLLLTE